ncbi:MAG: hypothetical protein Q7K43_02565 [Candidatus Woesearchaeota archaeon]|nr:hypothetical protein [Candidatus Woesearchaeota archaeon]
MSAYEPRVQQHVHYHTCSWKQIIAYSLLGACVATYALKGGCASVVHEVKNALVAAESKLEEKLKEIMSEVKK